MAPVKPATRSTTHLVPTPGGPARATDFRAILLYGLGALLGFLAALLFLLPGLTGGDQLSLIEALRQRFSTNSFALVAGFVTAGVALADIVVERQRDATREKKLNELNEAAQAKNELISSMTHQMRTPLTSTKYALKMLLGGDFGPVSAEQRDILTNLYGSTENLVTLTQDFLDASKLDAGRLQVSVKNIRLGELERGIKSAVDRLQPMAEGKKIALAYAGQVDEGITLRADANKLWQVAENLTENAINYTPNGGSVRVTATSSPSGLKLKIGDTGIGIPPAEQAKVFTKFFRASNARATSSTGTGIGLFISKKFVEAHHGTITFVSRPGKGTTFTVTVPLLPPSVAEQFFIRI
ncbi:MAG: HAMP domain-containing sensor histidine kinase [bacterium]|nr:HAMP domain-containing sensor histidine kinase [bacterium]